MAQDVKVEIASRVGMLGLTEEFAMQYSAPQAERE